MSKQKDIELSNMGENLIQKSGRFIYDAQELSDIVILDNHHKDPNDSSMVLSSKMLIEKFKGFETLARELKTDLRKGIEESTIKDRINDFGPNKFQPPHIKGIYELVMENFDDVINQILLGAAIVSIIIGLIQHPFPEGMIEGTSIMIALFIIIVVNSGNNYLSERRLAELLALSDLQDVAVFRDSTEPTTMDASELVVGDLFAFEMGMKVPADCIMVEGQNVQTIEGELTGEPDNMDKVPVTLENYRKEACCTMMAKSLICSGFGKAVVVAVGTRTVAGVITEKTQKPAEQTLLQEKLATIADKIGNVGTFVSSLTFFAQLGRLILEMNGYMECGTTNIFIQQHVEGCIPLTWKYDSEGDNRFYMEILQAIIISITVIVVAIPEGLPLAVTISLSFSSAAMKKLNNLVRKLASSETMGGATHICSDKTGTLTLNKMTVMSLMALNQVHKMGSSVGRQLTDDSKNGTQNVKHGSQSVWDIIIESVLWNSSARVEKNPGTDPAVQGEFITQGNVTEQGLLKFFMHDIRGQGILDKKASLDNQLLQVIQFTSSRKKASVVVKTANGVRVYTKGAPDMLFPCISNVLTNDGIVDKNAQAAVPYDLVLDGENTSGKTDTQMGLLERTVKVFADQAYRTILLSFRDLSMSEYEQIMRQNNNFEKEKDKEVLENELTAIGIFGLQDPLRETIVPSIIQCKNAGIQVIMCTGDNIDTAIAISKNAGIVTKEQIRESKYTAMTGKDFREAVGGLIQAPNPKKPGETKDAVKNMHEFKKIKEHLRVLARSSPEDKYILVTGVQDCDGVVAVTGDGTNDAPALTKADVGFAMGITGTDVAKGACDIILLDDNFSSIVVALKYGRNVYDNVRKFLQFQLTVNVVAMFIVFFGSVILKDSPLTAVQMLWVNLIMDTLAALALATEPPQEDILNRQPYHKDAPIVTEVMWRNVFGHALYQMFVIIVIIFVWPHTSLIHPYDLQMIELTGEMGVGGYNPWFTKGHYVTEDEITKWKLVRDSIGLTDEMKAITDDSSEEEIIAANKTQHIKYSEAFDFRSYYSFFCEHFKKHEDNYDYVSQWEMDNSLPFVCSVIAAHEYDPKYQEVIDWAREKNDENPWYPWMQESDVPTQKALHFTYIFQVFVFMQVFNQINAKKIELGEINVFKGIFNNMLFVWITILTFLIQMAMVEMGGKVVKAFPLSWKENLLCFFIGAVELIVGFAIKFTPLALWQCVSIDQTPISESEATSITATLKKSSTMRRGANNDNYTKA